MDDAVCTNPGTFRPPAVGVSDVTRPKYEANISYITDDVS